MQRLFVGLEIPESWWPQLDNARGGVEGANWQRDDQLHLTLAFIGHASKKVMRDIEGELAGVSFAPFELQLSGVGHFGKDGNVRTLWTGVKDPAPVQILHEKIMYRLGGMGLMLDQRRFVPHVTLARFPRRARPDVEGWYHANDTLKTPEDWFSHFTLFSSHKTAEGRFYRREASFGLGHEDWCEGAWEAETTADADDRRRSADWYMAGEPAWA